MSKLHQAIERNPGHAFLAFLALHGLVWTALPALFFLNLPLDLIEALTYGREWQFGYDKLPPLPWWMVEVTYRLFRHDLFYYALSQATILSTFALIWVMGRKLVGATGALVAILILDGLHYFQFTAPKFNHDVVQLPFWALAGVSYWAALQRGRSIHWALLGFAIGMAVWAKYFVVVLVVPLALFMLLDRQARRALLTPGPWVAIAIALIVMAPHAVWLLQHDFLPFRYAEARAVPFSRHLDYLIKPLLFLLSQLLDLLPALLIATPYLRRDASEVIEPARRADDFDRRIVAMLAFGPAAAVAVLSLITGRGAVSLWAYPLSLFFGLWIVLQALPLKRLTFTRVVATWAVVFVALAATFALHYGVQPYFRHRYIAVLFPGDQLGHEISRRYRAITGKPLVYVIGRMWAGGNVSRYAPERPRVLIDGDPRRAPWIDLGDLRARGAAAVWISGDPRVLPPDFRAIAEDAEIQQPFVLPYRIGSGSVTVGWAVLRPRPAVAQLQRQ